MQGIAWVTLTAAGGAGVPDDRSRNDRGARQWSHHEGVSSTGAQASTAGDSRGGAFSTACDVKDSVRFTRQLATRIESLMELIATSFLGKRGVLASSPRSSTAAGTGACGQPLVRSF